MKRAIVVVIDGLGVGSPDGTYNTLASVLSAAEKPPTDGVASLLVHLSSKQKVLPAYSGADSYRGHYEMIGVATQAEHVVLANCAQQITDFFAKRHVVEVKPGVFAVDDTFYVSNNVEAEFGSAVNLLVNLDKWSWNDAVDTGKGLSKVLGCERVIVMGNGGLTTASVTAALQAYLPAKRKDPIYGVVPALANIYDNNYHCYHVGKALVSYTQRNLITDLSNSGLDIHLIGKVGDILQADSPHVSSFPAVDVASTAKRLYNSVSGGVPFVFANFQSLDLQCHARKPQDALRAFTEICDSIDRVAESLTDEDLLIVTGDHGNDPEAPGNMHTREYVPVLPITKAPAKAPMNLRNDLGRVDQLVSQQLLSK